MSATIDEGSYQRLVSAMEGLRTFAAVAGWDTEAQSEIARIETGVQALDSEIAARERVLEDAKHARASKGFVAKLFDSGKAVKASQIALDSAQANRRRYDEMAEKLQELIDFTPNDGGEQKALVKELKQYKKELALKKREVATEMKNVRVSARQASANIGGNYGNKWAGQMNASQRRSIRLQKEALLGPREDQKSALERQLVAVDRRILWAERLSG